MWLPTSAVCEKGSTPKIEPYPGIYRIYDIAGKLLYVGRSKNVQKRLQQHFNGTTHTALFCKNMHKALITYAKHLGQDINLRKAERFFIQKTKPLYNKKCVNQDEELSFEDLLDYAPEVRFFNAISKLIEEGKAYLMKMGDYEEKEGCLIGYEDNKYYYLLPKVVFPQVVLFYEEKGEEFDLTTRALYKSLAEEKLILSKVENGTLRTTLKKRIPGRPETMTRLLFVPKKNNRGFVI
ncbi:GIY-YIG nuclease family protein [Sutcliffiella horikoshii]|uniref:GIY-YIG nuclease family protein n=1 Tax=Sutcliffiella horikoshii TaxID=79883 RepID=A0A5D4SC14_9BACI|nr:GIY-YIG nuclease family protein [Sutcliffiella horikoshii]TYS60509.1 GIY-YIG nuclease family protein [Sutcliffiella horikoshii]